ncbi:pyridoxal phosphate-dependent aminotransferase [Proteiniclasticum ruminis]|uniref:Aminotransferase n=1 Tax=Proteiniclasticum ruminis TaxID=398199 RepID=A0A1I4Y5F3_9CLOT|nr:pyridoxal phosphate-dependent aminotransferase [Proteiniclasticum ruminis]SFN32799.1 aspartate aminotransferase [Proteiniclasticum ruminis]
MNLSNRINEMKFSPIRKLSPYAQAARKKGLKVLGLNIGQPDIETPPQFMETIKKYDEKVLKYSESRGEAVLLESFIRYYKDYGIEFTEENLIITNGGSEALQFALFSLLNPDEEVLIPEPFYTNYSSFTDIVGCKVRAITTYGDDGFHLPKMETMESLITEKTRAILISSPSNPTGTIYTKEEIRMLADLCLKYDLYLISDEVYREFVYDGLEVHSPMDIPEIEDRVVLIDSISKRYSACGARIGLVASRNKAIIQAMMKLAQSRLCAPTLEQVAAAALYETPKSYFEAVKKEYQERRDILFEGISKIPQVKVKKPTGAFYMMIELPIDNAEDFCMWILEKFSYKNTTIMMAPAEGFYLTKGLGVKEVRLSYCINQEDLSLAVEILKLAIEEYNKK